MTRHHIMDELRDLPGTAQTRGEDDFIDVESHTMNLPAVRPDAQLAIPVFDEARLLSQMIDIADGAKPWPGRYWWASALVEAIAAADAAMFRSLIVAGLAHGFDGVKVSEDEFKYALDEFDAARAGA